MRKFFSALISIAIPLAFAFLGMLILLLSNPEVSIDEGWRLGWIGLGSGLLLGVVLVTWYWRRRAPSSHSRKTLD
ncbi:hypothetical protein ACNI65_02650 [Roseateles sp. So40a]|uniref:hypothetical protein n=1 Tax=Roseateles sp. So40a TaxID=3400226 RepID=UPI003A893303